MCKPAKSILIAWIIILAIFVVFMLIRFMKINSCLDQGGHWNNEINKCETPEEYNRNFYWYTAADTVFNREYLVRGELLDEIYNSSTKLIQALNRREPKCKIELISLNNDTIHIRFQNEESLTEQMGSTGAFCFMGETVYTLTEHDSIKFVDFQINFGSHASPGVYQRSDFKELDKKDVSK